MLNPNSVNYFTAIPNGLIGYLNCYELAVFVALRYHGIEAYPSHSRIAELAGVSTRTVRRALDSLREKGIVTWVSRASEKGQISNFYTVHLDGHWVQSARPACTPLACESYPPGL